MYGSRNELYHFGVKKMTWGTRRYQNEDGTLTPLGKIHYAKGGKNRKTDVLTDDEIKQATERMKLEKSYNEAERELKQSQKGTKAKNTTSKLLSDIGETAVKNIGTQAATYALGVGVNKLLQKIYKTDEQLINPKKGQKDK